MQTVPSLSVLITNFNTAQFVKLSLYALQRLTVHPYVVLINDNGSKPADIAALKRLAAAYPNVELILRQSRYTQASFAHAEALDLLIQRVNTPYTVVLDSDCAFLLRGWDQELIGSLTETVKIVGTPLQQGASGRKPHDFPFQFAVLFDTDIYHTLRISCMPRDLKQGEDTCWEWKPKFLAAGYAGKVLTARHTRYHKDGPFGHLICAEYYTDDGRLIASHFGRGSSGGVNKYLKRPLWRRLEPGLTWFRQMKGWQETRSWMRTCRRIIDAQATR